MKPVKTKPKYVPQPDDIALDNVAMIEKEPHSGLCKIVMDNGEYHFVGGGIRCALGAIADAELNHRLDFLERNGEGWDY